MIGYKRVVRGGRLAAGPTELLLGQHLLAHYEVEFIDVDAAGDS